MEHQNLLLKISRLFPSSLISCQSRTLPDVADSSIFITKTKKIPTENDHGHSSILQLPPKPDEIYSSVPNKPSKSRNQRLNHCSDAEGRKHPPVTSSSTIYPKKVIKNRSTSSNSGQWFTSGDERTRGAAEWFETDAFFSLSSNSGDSFCLKNTSRRFARKCGEIKSMDEKARGSFSSLASYDTVPSRCNRKTAARGAAAEKAATKCCEKKSSVTFPEYELGSDHASTQIYYQNSFRHRKNAQSRRKFTKSHSMSSFSDGSMIKEGFPVEKSSSDPYRDFMASMVEMIIEKKMFGAEDLDRLLFCFLSLNEVDYHGIIYEVFSEICQTLFSE